MNDEKNYIHKYYAQFLSSNNHSYVYSGSEYYSEKRRICRQKNIILDLLLKKLKSFEWQESLLIFLNNKKLSSNMVQISEHINSSNHKIHSYDQMREIIVNLGSNKGKNNNNNSPQLTCLQSSLLTSIVENLKRIYPILIGNMI